MGEYVIITDSSCDLPVELAKELEVEAAPLSVVLDGQVYRNFLDERDVKTEDFYQSLRQGKQGSTSAVNVDGFLQVMEPYLQQGKDILYLGFSSGLSATYHSGTIAADELSLKYPEAKILTVDTLCASMGQGLMVYLAVQEKRKGRSIEEVKEYVERMKLNICHWFTVDDLNHLKRGGRISAAAALLGSTLNIKPILHVDNAGHLIPVSKVRGRKNSIKKLVEQMKETGMELDGQTVFISHGACIQDAQLLGELIREQMPVKEVIIGYVGPVIGSHSGPGTLALFFLGQHR